MAETIRCNRCSNDALTIEHDRFALCAQCWLDDNKHKHTRIKGTQTMARIEKGSVGWTEKEIQTLKQMRADKIPMKEIAAVIGKSPSACFNFVQRYGDRFGISVDRKKGTQTACTVDNWHGSVPYLHWTITKSWSKQQ